MKLKAPARKRINGADEFEIVGFPGLRIALRPTRNRRGLRISIGLPAPRAPQPRRGRPLSPATLRLRLMLDQHRRSGRLRDRNYYGQWLQVKSGLDRGSALQAVAREVRRLGSIGVQVQRARPGRRPSQLVLDLQTRIRSDIARGYRRSHAGYRQWLMRKGLTRERATELLRRQVRRGTLPPRAPSMKSPWGKTKSSHLR